MEIQSYTYRLIVSIWLSDLHYYLGKLKWGQQKHTKIIIFIKW